MEENQHKYLEELKMNFKWVSNAIPEGNFGETPERILALITKKKTNQEIYSINLIRNSRSAPNIYTWKNAGEKKQILPFSILGQVLLEEVLATTSSHVFLCLLPIIT